MEQNTNTEQSLVFVEEAIGNALSLCIPGMDWTDDIGAAAKSDLEHALAIVKKLQQKGA